MTRLEILKYLPQEKQRPRRIHHWNPPGCWIITEKTASEANP